VWVNDNDSEEEVDRSWNSTEHDPSDQVAETCSISNLYNLPTCMFYYSLKGSYRLQNIFANPREFLGLCWVVFRSLHFADAKRKELVCITLEFFLNSACGNRIWAICKKIWAGKWDCSPPPPPFSGPSNLNWTALTKIQHKTCFQNNTVDNYQDDLRVSSSSHFHFPVATWRQLTEVLH